MPRHSQPREIAELKGAVAHDPQRYNKDIPKSEMPLGSAPPRMDEEHQAIWFELEACVVVGVLTFAERPMFEMAVNLMTEMIRDPDGFAATRMNVLIGLLARFGMSPADRQKLSIKPKDGKPKFSTL